METQAQTQAIPCRFVVDKVAMEQDFLQEIQFSPASTIPPMLHSYLSMYHWH